MNIHEIEKIFLENCHFIIGIDEAGRGPLAGPVTVGAVLLDKDSLTDISNMEKLDDSKKLSHKKRVVLEKEILEKSLHNSISDVDVETIDRINILEATKLGILNCLEEIASSFLKRRIEKDSTLGSDQGEITPSPSLHKEGEKTTKKKTIGILIDGKFNNIKELISELAEFKDINFDVQTVIDGDALCPSIAAASILAKEHRDKLMEKLHLTYPEYAFDKHKGYGTKLHMERLNLFGPSDIHRKSFAPVSLLLKK